MSVGGDNASKDGAKQNFFHDNPPSSEIGLKGDVGRFGATIAISI